MSISQERTERVLKMFISENLNLCGCLGAINGQPHCPCKMARLAKEQKPLVDAVGGENAKLTYRLASSNYAIWRKYPTGTNTNTESTGVATHSNKNINTGITDMSNEKLETGLTSHLTQKLDVEDGRMGVFVDDTEIGHYLTMHINDQENLEGWQNHVCLVGVETIKKLQAEVKRLRKIIKDEAEYQHCQALEYAKNGYMRIAVQKEYHCKILENNI